MALSPQGAVWTMKFSHCGRLLASAGQDNMVRIWVLKNAFDYFNNMRLKYNTDGRVSPSPSQESLNSSKSDNDAGVCSGADEDPDDRSTPFRQRPFCKYKGHTADLLDLSWSKNYFLLSSSMDKTVRLWHISRRECLCCFQHIDFVTAIAFHPRDDRYFLSGSLDGKLRLWNIPDKKVALWNEVDGQTKLITAANFCQNGKYAVIGTYDGRCIFYDTEHLKYHTQIHVRSTRGRNRVGRKITGIEPLPGENKILVTSNDSRIRLYDLRDLSLSMKYKGYVNSSSQIKASFSHDFTYIVSGSEDKYVYIWSTYHDLSKFTSVRRDRNDFWEGVKGEAFPLHNTRPGAIFNCRRSNKSHLGRVPEGGGGVMHCRKEAPAFGGCTPRTSPLQKGSDLGLAACSPSRPASPTAASHPLLAIRLMGYKQGWGLQGGRCSPAAENRSVAPPALQLSRS
ncbi:WD repeat-containing protein 44 [Varanus komodoensis]|nr:WD repeat-containing protein 44 [Varanus komodoensis]